MKKLVPKFVAFALAIALTLGTLSKPMNATETQQQESIGTQDRQAPLRSAYERGYLNGYEDGYRSGMADYGEMKDQDYQRFRLYRDADRDYQPQYGALADYQAGYRLGFEIAYKDGYYGRAYSSKIPPHALVLKGTSTQTGRPRGTTVITGGTEMRLRLATQLDTKMNLEGDHFMASVIEPAKYEWATVEGHIARLKRSGTMAGRTELALDFDRISLRDGRKGAFYARIEKIYATESIKSIDEEGKIESASKTKETEIRTGGGAVLGAIIGGIAGGGAGAAIGAIIGAGVGAGSVYVQGNKDLILEPGTEMTVRTFTPRNINARQ